MKTKTFVQGLWPISGPLGKQRQARFGPYRPLQGQRISQLVPLVVWFLMPLGTEISQSFLYQKN